MSHDGLPFESSLVDQQRVIKQRYPKIFLAIGFALGGYLKHKDVSLTEINEYVAKNAKKLPLKIYAQYVEGIRVGFSRLIKGESLVQVDPAAEEVATIIISMFLMLMISLM